MLEFNVNSCVLRSARNGAAVRVWCEEGVSCSGIWEGLRVVQSPALPTGRVQVNG